jgi:hypothetical protein
MVRVFTAGPPSWWVRDVSVRFVGGHGQCPDPREFHDGFARREV